MSVRINRSSVLFGAIVAVAVVSFAQRLSGATAPAASLPSPVVDDHSTAKTETAVFAGGCFWGIQSVFQHTKGVIKATSGYAGGFTDKPSYEQVSSGRTGH